MNHFFKYLIKSLYFFRRTNFGVVLGVMVSTAIITGALIIGDSVRYSLKQMALLRLGRTDYAMETADRYFSWDLADSLQKYSKHAVAPFLKLTGIAIARGGESRLNHVQVLGVDHRFWKMGNTFNILKNKSSNEAAINSSLARQLNINVGDELLLRIRDTQSLGLDIPLAKKENNSIALRLSVAMILDETQFGRFGLEANQIPPNTVFLPHQFLSNKMGLENQCNGLLARKKQPIADDPELLERTFAQVWRFQDTDLRIRALPDQTGLEILSNRVFIDPSISSVIDSSNQNILSYFVNSISSHKKSTPYSFVTGVDHSPFIQGMRDDEIVINDWLAEDLNVRQDDPITLTYYKMGNGFQLNEMSSQFHVHSIIPLTHDPFMRMFMPEIFGLSDAENCREWDPGIPIDLNKIRDKDEKYWDHYQGTPKAFITLNAAQKMWANRYGNSTAIRLKTESTKTQLSKEIMQDLNPASLGFHFRPVREDALAASEKGVDFGQLFLGLSFFIISASMILTGLLFSFNVQQRSEEILTLLSLGFSKRSVRFYSLAEGLVLAIIGSVFGICVAILYNHLVLFALGTVWKGAVGTSYLVAYVKWTTCLIGMVIGISVSWIVISFAVQKQMNRSGYHLNLTPPSQAIVSPKRDTILKLLGVLCIGFVLVMMFYIDPIQNQHAAGLFWGFGFLMLMGCFFILYGWIHPSPLSVFKKTTRLYPLILQNIGRKKGRSLGLVFLLACGIFVIVGVGANRLDSIKNAHERDSGTGGFMFYGETTVPIFYDLNSEKSLYQLGLSDTSQYQTEFIQLRHQTGVDASCLNLNRVANPKIIGVDPGMFAQKGAFAFQSLSDEISINDPWMVLNQDIGDHIIPGFADQSVIQWGLGKSIGDSLIYKDEKGRTFIVKLMGGLKNSIFQGSVIIANHHFISHYPSTGGSRIFLVDVLKGDPLKILQILNQTMQDYGVHLQLTYERLSLFNQVQNTYLSIFLALGGLGLLLGSVGVGIIIYRDIMERREEFAVLRAIGFQINLIQKMEFFEYFILFGTGIVCGLLSAILAVIPAIQSPGSEIPYGFLCVLIFVIMLSGSGWIYLSIRGAMKRNLIEALRNE